MNKNLILILFSFAVTSPVFAMKRNGDSEDLSTLLFAEIKKVASQANLTSARELLKQGANANATRGQFGMTALMIAAQNGNEPMCQLLIEHGANVNTKDNNGITAWITAYSHKHQEICSLLERNGAQPELEKTSSEMPPKTWRVSEESLAKYLNSRPGKQGSKKADEPAKKQEKKENKFIVLILLTQYVEAL